MTGISFDHLDSTEFESLCHDLLGEMGFVNVNWRKGTPRATSPADSGRDIEAEFVHTGVDGETFLEKWFIECKHHSRAVSPNDIQNLLTWAEAERPDRAIVVVSGFLSNPAKDYLAKYRQNNRPAFRISTWERPKLDELLRGYPDLVYRYRLAPDVPDLGYLHPIHQLYVAKPPINTLTYFFDLVERLDPDDRDEALGWVKTLVINPRMRAPSGDSETMADLLMEPVNYSSFKKKCLALDVTDIFMVQSLVSWTLTTLGGFRRPGEVDQVRAKHERALEFFRAELTKRPDDAKTLEGLIGKTEGWIEGLPRRFERTARIYETFCEAVVAPLFLEEMPLGVE